jgi:hypothetical protein
MRNGWTVSPVAWIHAVHTLLTRRKYSFPKRVSRFSRRIFESMARFPHAYNWDNSMVGGIWPHGYVSHVKEPPGETRVRVIAWYDEGLRAGLFVARDESERRGRNGWKVLDRHDPCEARQPCRRRSGKIGHFQYMGDVVGGAGQEALAIGVEAHLLDGRVVAQWLGERLAAGDIPDARRFVGGGGGDAVAIRAELHIRYAVVMRECTGQRCTAVGVPEARSAVPRRRGDAQAIRAECRFHDRARMAEHG